MVNTTQHATATPAKKTLRDLPLELLWRVLLDVSPAGLRTVAALYKDRRSVFKRAISSKRPKALPQQVTSSAEAEEIPEKVAFLLKQSEYEQQPIFSLNIDGLFAEHYVYHHLTRHWPAAKKPTRQDPVIRSYMNYMLIKYREKKQNAPTLFAHRSYLSLPLHTQHTYQEPINRYWLVTRKLLDFLGLYQEKNGHLLFKPSTRDYVEIEFFKFLFINSLNHPKEIKEKFATGKGFANPPPHDLEPEFTQFLVWFPRDAKADAMAWLAQVLEIQAAKGFSFKEKYLLFQSITLYLEKQAGAWAGVYLAAINIFGLFHLPDDSNPDHRRCIIRGISYLLTIQSQMAALVENSDTNNSGCALLLHKILARFYYSISNVEGVVYPIDPRADGLLDICEKREADTERPPIMSLREVLQNLRDIMDSDGDLIYAPHATPAYYEEVVLSGNPMKPVLEAYLPIYEKLAVATGKELSALLFEPRYNRPNDELKTVENTQVAVCR